MDNLTAATAVTAVERTIWMIRESGGKASRDDLDRLYRVTWRRTYAGLTRALSSGDVRQRVIGGQHFFLEVNSDQDNEIEEEIIRSQKAARAAAQEELPPEDEHPEQDVSEVTGEQLWEETQALTEERAKHALWEMSIRVQSLLSRIEVLEDALTPQQIKGINWTQFEPTKKDHRIAGDADD